MIVLRKLYSDDTKSAEKKLDERDAEVAALGGAYLVRNASYRRGRKFGKNLEKAVKRKSLTEEERKESDKIYEAIKSRAEKEGFTITKHEDFDNAAYIPNDVKSSYDGLDKIPDKELREKLKKNSKRGWDEKGIELEKLSRGKKNIVEGPKFQSPEILAHELGHGTKSLSKKKLERIGQKAAFPGRLSAALGGNVAFINGLSAGYDEEMNEKKESKLSRYSGTALSALGHSGTLSAEIGASKGAMKYLKEAGASEKLLKRSRKNLGTALGTYAATSLGDVAATEVSHAVGKSFGRQLAKKEKRHMNRED